LLTVVTFGAVCAIVAITFVVLIEAPGFIVAVVNRADVLVVTILLLAQGALAIDASITNGAIALIVALLLHCDGRPIFVAKASNGALAPASIGSTEPVQTLALETVLSGGTIGRPYTLHALPNFLVANQSSHGAFSI